MEVEMATQGEQIERLARENERREILDVVRAAKTLEEVRAYLEAKLGKQ